MATLEQLEAAFVKADDAGNVEDARAFADEIRRLRATQQPVDRESGLSLSDLVSGKKAKPSRSFFALPEAVTNPTPENIASDPLVRFALGAGKGVAGAYQFLSRALPDTQLLPQIFTRSANQPGADYLVNQFDRVEKMGKPDGMNVAGFAGEVMSPIGLGMSKAMPTAATGIKRIGQGALFGAGFGASQPVTGEKQDQFGEEKAKQILTGAAFGTVIPGGIEVTKFVGRRVGEVAELIMANMSESARQKFASKLATININEIVGEKNLQRVVAELEKRAGEAQKVPGYKPTVGELVADIPAASPVLALQKGTGKTAGGVSAQFGERLKSQNEALQAALRPIAGTPEQLGQAIAERGAIGDSLYGAAIKQVVKPDERLQQIASNPYFEQALPKAQEMARAAGTQDITSILHNVKLELDRRLMGIGEAAVNKGERRLIGELQREIVGWLGNANSAYKTARETFKSQSIPINRMQVGQEIESKLFPPTGQTTPIAYMRAIDDASRTIKSATGQPRMEFGQVFNPAERQTIENIGGLLERRLQANHPLQPTVIGGQNIAEQGILSLPNLLSRPAMVANWVLTRLKGRSGPIESAIDEINAARLLNPDEFVRALKTLPQSEQSFVYRTLGAHPEYLMNQGLLAPMTIATQQ